MISLLWNNCIYVHIHNYLWKKMAQHCPHIGCPHVGHLWKHIEGWDGINKIIFILKSPYEKWGQLKQLKNLHNDNAVTQYFLSCYVNLSAQWCQSTQKESPEVPVTFEDIDDESSLNYSILRWRHFPAQPLCMCRNYTFLLHNLFICHYKFLNDFYIIAQPL